MPRNPSQIYKYHVANLGAIESAITVVSRLVREAIKTQDSKNNLDALVKLYWFLLAAYAENRLNKILNEEYGFSEDERKLILGNRKQFDQWNSAIDASYQKYYGVPVENFESTLPQKDYGSYKKIRELIEDDLKPVIEMRNRLAHGQWIYPFNSKKTELNDEKYQLMQKENFQTLQLKYNLLRNLADLIHDLIVSEPTFKRDFERRYRIIEQLKTNIRTKKYEDYEKSLIKKHEEGKIKREQNKSS